MKDVAGRQSLTAVRAIKAAGALSLVVFLYLVVFRAGGPAEFYTLLSLIVMTGAAASVLYAQRRDASRPVLLLAAVIGAALTWVIVYNLVVVGAVFFAER